MDTPQLLKSLNDHNVRYVIIGASAFPVHGYSRATLDIDIFIDSTEENARNALLALKDYGYDVTDLSVEDLLSKKILIRGYDNLNLPLPQALLTSLYSVTSSSKYSHILYTTVH